MMYVASEWFGVLTVDIKNIFSEINRGKTLTGGWCHGSSFAKNRLAEASEGYGIRLFDMSVMQSPQLLAEDTAVGFCRAISISDSADYVYGWFLTGKRLRVRDGNNLSFVSDTTVDPGTFIISDFKKSRKGNGKLAVIEEINSNNQRIITADVNNPLQPFVQNIRQKNSVEDILFHPSGRLLVCADDSLIVFNENTMAVITGITPPLGGLQQYKAFTLYNDTLYVYYSGIGEGIAKYYYNPSLQTLTYISAAVFDVKSVNRVFMSSDDSLLYIGSTIDSLKAISKTAPYKLIAIYNHGADHIYDNLWGMTDLYHRDNYLFLNEYMGQTSIFGKPTITTGIQPLHQSAIPLVLYPNPCRDYFIISTGTKTESEIKVFNPEGKLVYFLDVRGEKIKLSTAGLGSGIYFVSVTAEGKTSSIKLAVEK